MWCGILTAAAQDLIVKTDASKIEANVVEVSPDAVRYKRFSNPDGPTYVLPVAEIHYIRYANGEKEFGHVLEPRMEQGLFGSDDSISDYEPGSRDWHGTFMVSGDTPEEAEARRESVINRIIEECGVDTYIDGTPDVI